MLLTYLTADGPDEDGLLTVTTSANTGFGRVAAVESDDASYTPQDAVGEFAYIESVPRVVRVNGIVSPSLAVNTSTPRKIEIVDTELAAPGDITVAIGTHTGNSATATADGSITILDDAFTSTGSIVFTAGTEPGFTTIEVTVGNDFVFEETGTDTVTFTVLVLPTDHLYVRETGDDDTGDGTAGNPFRTVTHALSFTPGVSVIDVGPGLYDDAAGESFPLALTPGVHILGAGRGETILDGDNAVHHLFTATDLAEADAGVLSGMTLRHTARDLVRANNAHWTLEEILFLQNTSDTGQAGGLWVDNGSTITVNDSTFRDMERITTVEVRGDSTFYANRCEFLDNWSSHGTLANNSGGNASLYLTDCLFDNNEVPDNRRHDSYAGTVIRMHSNHGFATHLSLERCVVARGRGGNVVGMARSSTVVRNSLFVENTPTYGMFLAHASTAELINCTFIRNSGTYAGRSCTTSIRNGIIYDDDYLMQHLNDNWNANDPDRLRLYNVAVYATEMGLGDGFNQILSQNVTLDVDPLLYAPDEPYVGGDLDARLRSYSPFVDAGDNTHVLEGALDLAGLPRIVDGWRDGVETVDLGAYESQFGQPDGPGFLLGKPEYALFAGASLELTVGLTNAVGPLTATVDVDDGATADPTLVFAESADEALLTITADTPMTVADGAYVPVTVAADGFESLLFALRIYESQMVTDGPDRRFVRQGETADVRFMMPTEALTAPEDITVSAGPFMGPGNNTGAWEGSPVIPEGGSETEGVFRFTGGLGINTVTFSADLHLQPVTLEIVGHPGYVYVCAATGDDTLGDGSLGSPLGTIGYAAAMLQPGEEVRVLPGTYGPANGETLPIQPGYAHVIGVNADGVADGSRPTLDGDGEPTLLRYENLDAEPYARLAHIELLNTSAEAILQFGGTLLLDNCRFTQPGETLGAYGALYLRAGATVLAEDCLFEDMRRWSVVEVVEGSLFRATRCIIRNNYSHRGTIANNTSSAASMEFFECRFDNNEVSDDRPHDSYIGSVAFARNDSGNYASSIILLERCIVTRGSGGNVFGIRHIPLVVRNSLFVENDTTFGMVHGYHYSSDFVNCTFIRNSGNYAGRDPSSARGGANLRNSIVYNDNELMFSNGNWTSSANNLRLYNVMVYDTPPGLGDGYNTSLSENVHWDVDPRMRNADAPWGDSQFDATLRPRLSPAVNAGNNAAVVGDFDLNGGPRILHDIVDLGAYEALIPPEGTVILVR